MDMTTRDTPYIGGIHTHCIAFPGVLIYLFLLYPSLYISTGILLTYVSYKTYFFRRATKSKNGRRLGQPGKVQGIFMTCIHYLEWIALTDVLLYYDDLQLRLRYQMHA